MKRSKARPSLSEQASSQEGPNSATPETARRSTRLQPSTPMHMRTRAASRTASTAPSHSRNASSAGSTKSTATTTAGRKRRASSPGAGALIGPDERPAKRSRSNAPAENVVASPSPPTRARAAKRKPEGVYEEKDTDHDEQASESDRPASSSRTSQDAKSESRLEEFAPVQAQPVNGDAHEESEERKDSFHESRATAVAGDETPVKQPSPVEQVTCTNDVTTAPGSPASATAGPKPRGRGRWGRIRVAKEPKASVEPSDKVVKKRLPGRRRAPNPNDSIEADMRRQLQLRMSYRAVVKHLKPILQEIANRTEEKIDNDPEYHKTSERFEIVDSQLNQRLQSRLHDINMEEKIIVDHAVRMYENESDLARTQYREKVERIRDDMVDHLMHVYLVAMRKDDKQQDEDATDDEDGGLIPLTKHRYPNGDLESISDPRYASRSRYFMETERLWDEREERLQFAKDLSQPGEKFTPKPPGKFATYHGPDREVALATLNVSNLARASQAVEEGHPEPPKHIENSAATALQALASAAESAPLATKPPKKPVLPPQPPAPLMSQEIITPSRPPNLAPQSSTQEKPGSVYVKWRLESHKKPRPSQTNGVRSAKKEATTRSPAKISELLNQEQAEDRHAHIVARPSKTSEDDAPLMGQIPPLRQKSPSPPRMPVERRGSTQAGPERGRRHSTTHHPGQRPNEPATVPIGSERTQIQMLQEPLRENRPPDRPMLQPAAQFPNEPRREYYQTPYRERSPERAPMPPPAIQHVSGAHRRTRTSSGSASALASPVTPGPAEQSPVPGPTWPVHHGVERSGYAKDRRSSADSSHQRRPPAAMPPILHPSQPEPNRSQEPGYQARVPSHSYPYASTQPPPNPPPPPFASQYAPPPPPPHIHWPQAGSSTSYVPPPRRYSGHGPLGPPPPPPNLPPATTQPYPQGYTQTLPPHPPAPAYTGYTSQPPPPPSLPPPPPPPNYAQAPPPAGAPYQPYPHLAPQPQPPIPPQYTQQFGGTPILPANLDPRHNPNPHPPSHPAPQPHHTAPPPQQSQAPSQPLPPPPPPPAQQPQYQQQHQSHHQQQQHHQQHQQHQQQHHQQHHQHPQHQQHPQHPQHPQHQQHPQHTQHPQQIQPSPAFAQYHHWNSGTGGQGHGHGQGQGASAGGAPPARRRRRQRSSVGSRGGGTSGSASGVGDGRRGE
ncbi:MAG: hypothetical protein M1822_010061 [Bathelium mastoideum]|nr:MAG: hypothetical protein M1822_010061 [Bathelium mastoideum]